jgi:putative membrane protein
MKWTARASGVVVLVLAVVFAVQGQAPQDQDKPFTDNEFMTNVASGNLAEIEIGKIGQTKASNAEVKQLAERIVKDHTKALEELTEIAREAGVKLPDRPMPDHQKEVDRFRDYKGETFDRDFATHMIKCHEKSIELFTRATREAKDTKLRAFATKTLPTLKEHLELARKAESGLPKGQ